MSNVRIQIFQDKEFAWRWRLTSGNNKIIADGSEGYSTKGNIRKAVARFQMLFEEMNQRGAIPVIWPKEKL